MLKLSWKPVTVDEAMRALDELLTSDEKVKIATAAKEELITYHHGLGRWIRNNWGLWAGSPLLDHMKVIGFRHPDDMSQAIIHEYWARLNKKPSIIDEEIKFYAEYWEKADSMKKEQ